MVPERCIAGAWSLPEASKAIPFSDRYSLELLNHARPPPTASAEGAERAQDDRRGGRRAAVHAVCGVAAAVDARARGGDPIAREGGARRASHRCGTAARGA